MEEQRRGERHRVHAVEDPAVALDHSAPVFDAEIALDRRTDMMVLGQRMPTAVGDT
jgi:hypothetical protein